MVNLFFGENRFVMKGVEDFRTLAQGVKQQSLGDEALMDVYNQNDPALRAAYENVLEEEDVPKSKFEEEWMVLGLDLGALGASIADGLVASPPGGPTVPTAAEAAIAAVPAVQAEAAATAVAATPDVPAGAEAAEALTVDELLAKAGQSEHRDTLMDLFKVKDALKTIDGGLGDSQGNIDFGVFDNKNSGVFKRVYDGYEKVFEEHNDKAKSFASLLRIKEEEAIGVLAVIYTKSVMAQMKMDLGKHKDFLADSSQEGEKKITGYKVSVLSQASDGFTVTYEPEDVWLKYKAYKDAKESAEGQPAMDSTEVARLEAIQKTWVGKFLGFMGYGDERKNGKTGFEEILSGKDFFGIFLLGIFGYASLVPEFKEMISSLPESVSKPIEDFAKSAEKADITRKMEKAFSEGEALMTQFNAKKVSVEQFSKGFDNSEKKFVTGEENFKITGKYKIEGAMKVTIPAGCQLSIPYSTDLVLPHGFGYDAKGRCKIESPAVGTDPKAYTFTGSFPEGLIVVGKGIEFKLEGDASTPAVDTTKPAAVDAAVTPDPAKPADDAAKPADDAVKPETAAKPAVDAKPDVATPPVAEKPADPANKPVVAATADATGTAGATTDPAAKKS